MTLDKYIQGMLLGRMWATSSEIQAAATLFGCNIYMWVPQSPVYFMRQFKPDQNILTLPNVDILLEGAHFNPLKKSTPMPIAIATSPQQTNFHDQKYQSKSKNLERKCS